MTYYARQNNGSRVALFGQQSPPPPTNFGGPAADPIDLTTPVEPTSSTTGYRIPTADLDLWPGPYRFKNDSHSGGAAFIPVPPGGLTISGKLFDRNLLRIYADNPIHFVDCFFSGAPRVPEMDGYHIVTHPTDSGWPDSPDVGREMTFENCTFWGIGAAAILGQFKSIKNCSFNWAKADYLKPHTHTLVRNVHDFLIEGCWFGPHVNIADGPLNGGNGMYVPGNISSPHSDSLQVRSSDPRKITYRKCSFDWTADKWSDAVGPSTVNPNNNLGANPDKIVQIDGDSAGNIKTSVDVLEFDRCWIYGSGNSWFALHNHPTHNVLGWWTTFEARWFSNIIALDANLGGWTTSFDSNMTYTRVTDGNNKFMRTNSVSLRLPAEATNAGTQVFHSDTNSYSDVFSCEDWLLGLNSVTFYQSGLNEGGRTSFDRRSTPYP